MLAFDALELDGPAVSALAEALVRATIARASEFVEIPWSADIALSDEPAERIWQVAGIAPLGSLDQLRCRTPRSCLPGRWRRRRWRTPASPCADDRQDDGDLPRVTLAAPGTYFAGKPAWG